MVKNTAFFCIYLGILFFWLTVYIFFNVSYPIFLLGLIIISYISIKLILPGISFYFILTRKKSQEWHLQKKILPSIILFSLKQPGSALFKLYLDLLNNALPKALQKIPEGHTIIITTHLFNVKLIKCIPYIIEYEKTTPSSFQKLSACIALWISTIIRFILGKGWKKPKIHTWYRLSITKATETNY